MGEGLFLALLKRAKLPAPVREYPFAKELGRKWRADYCWPDHRLILEVDGGVWKKGGGRHTRGSGWMKDTEKLNTATVLGYRLLRCTPDQLATLSTVDLIRRCLTPSPADRAA